MSKVKTNLSYVMLSQSSKLQASLIQSTLGWNSSQGDTLIITDVQMDLLKDMMISPLQPNHKNSVKGICNLFYKEPRLWIRASQGEISSQYFPET